MPPRTPPPHEENFSSKAISKAREISKHRRSDSAERYYARERYYNRDSAARYNEVGGHRRRSDERFSDSNSSNRSSRRHRVRSRSLSVSPGPRRHGTREHPLASRCIGVFGLNTNTTQHKIRELFSKFGSIERIQMVIDAHTGRSRGFCFIYFEHLEDAKDAKNACSGIQVDDRRIRVDYSITQRPHTPTPGVYMGRPSKFVQRPRDRYDGQYGRLRRRTSVSPYYGERDRYERERRRTVSRYDYNSNRCERTKSRSRSPHRSRY